MNYGENIRRRVIKFTEKEKEFVQSFNCGNEVIDLYLKEKACNDPQSVTFIVLNNSDDSVICYYSLSCSGFILNHKNSITIYPAVEIKMFAMDKNYQDLQYSKNIEDGIFSDIIFSDVIAYIYNFTEKYCGADKIILYSVPNSYKFYIRNGFNKFEEYMLHSKSRYLKGCIPMYFDL